MKRPPDPKSAREVLARAGLARKPARRQALILALITLALILCFFY